SEFDSQPQLLDLIQRAEVQSEDGVAFPWQNTRDRMPQLMRELFQECETGGCFSIDDPELAVFQLLGGVRAIIRFGEKPRAPDLAHRIVKTFLYGACHRLASEPCQPGKGPAASSSRSNGKGPHIA